MKMKYEYKINLKNKNSVAAIIYHAIEVNSNILDVGCSIGKLGGFLKEDKQCRVVGIDYDRESLEIASQRVSKVGHIDLERDYYMGFTRLSHFLKEERFNYIILADVYEHLKNGKDILLKLSEYLSPGGVFFISVPNIIHHFARRKFLFGSFEYKRAGIFDATHVRFFTPKSIKNEIESLDLSINTMTYVGKLFLVKNRIYRFLKFLVGGRNHYHDLEFFLGNHFPGLFAFQIVLKVGKRDISH